MINGNDTAFPVSYEYNGTMVADGGLTKFEYLASLAMQGILTKNMSYFTKEEIAKYSVEQALALMEEINKQFNK